MGKGKRGSRKKSKRGQSRQPPDKGSILKLAAEKVLSHLSFFHLVPLAIGRWFGWRAGAIAATLCLVGWSAAEYDAVGKLFPPSVSLEEGTQLPPYAPVRIALEHVDKRQRDALRVNLLGIGGPVTSALVQGRDYEFKEGDTLLIHGPVFFPAFEANASASLRIDLDRDHLFHTQIQLAQKPTISLPIDAGLQRILPPRMAVSTQPFAASLMRDRMIRWKVPGSEPPAYSFLAGSFPFETSNHPDPSRLASRLENTLRMGSSAFGVSSGQPINYAPGDWADHAQLGVADIDLVVAGRLVDRVGIIQGFAPMQHQLGGQAFSIPTREASSWQSTTNPVGIRSAGPAKSTSAALHEPQSLKDERGSLEVRAGLYAIEFNYSGIEDGSLAIPFINGKFSVLVPRAFGDRRVSLKVGPGKRPFHSGRMRIHEGDIPRLYPVTKDEVISYGKVLPEALDRSAHLATLIVEVGTRMRDHWTSVDFELFIDHQPTATFSLDVRELPSTFFAECRRYNAPHLAI